MSVDDSMKSDDRRETQLPVRAFLWVTWPKLSSGGLQLLTNLLLARALGPADFGPLAVCLAAVLIADAVFGAAVDVGVLKLVTAQRVARSPYALELQKAALVGKAAVTGLMALPLLVLAGPITEAFLGNASSSALIGLSLAALLGLLLLRSVQTYFQSESRFALYGISDALQTVLKFGGIAVLLALHQASASGALLFYAIGPLVAAVGILATRAHGILVAPLRVDALRAVWAAVKWPIGAGAAGSITSRMDVLLVAAIAGPLEAGRFSAAQLLVLGFSLTGAYLGVAFAPRIMPAWESGRLGEMYARCQMVTLAACIVIFALGVVLIEPVASWLLPASYPETGTLVLWLLPSALAALLNFPIAISFLLFTRPRFLFGWDLVAIPALMLLYREGVAWRGALGAAAVTSIYALVKTAMLHLLVLRTLQKRRLELAAAGAPCTVTG